MAQIRQPNGSNVPRIGTAPPSGGSGGSGGGSGGQSQYLSSLEGNVTRSRVVITKKGKEKGLTPEIVLAAKGQQHHGFTDKEGLLNNLINNLGINFNPGPVKPPDLNTTDPYTLMAECLIKIALGLMARTVGNNNPMFNIAKLLAVKGLAETAQTYADTAVANLIGNGAPDARHRTLFVQAAAAGLRGNAETAYGYWKDAANANKALNKESQELARKA